MTTSAVRVRFAPSPTGHLHIGGLRTALFNWLFAQHNRGTFLLRIEDTDVQRSKAEYTTSILDSLAWAGLASDEPIVIQTDGLERHRRLAEQLLEQGDAYRCYCPKVEYADGSYTQYDGRCRDRAPQDLNLPSAIRLKLPESCSSIAFNDSIRGHVSFDAQQLDDFIIVRSDGMPTYNFVVVADDIEMRITHVIRGEEHISNTPRQILIYQALQAPIPLFAHLPMILGPSGAKLSKRDAATSVLEYRAQGYLPDALCNYLVRLGWSHGDQEIFTRQEMIDYFSLASIGSKGAIFDKNKLDWVNSIYMRNATSEELFEHITQNIDPAFVQKLEGWSFTIILRLIDLYKERVKTLAELAQELIELHAYNYSSHIVPDFITQQTSELLHQLVEQITKLQDFDVSTLQTTIKQLVAHHGLKLMALAQPLRFILTGKVATPGIFELMNLLGKDEIIKRIKQFLKKYPEE